MLSKSIFDCIVIAHTTTFALSADPQIERMIGKEEKEWEASCGIFTRYLLRFQ